MNQERVFIAVFSAICIGLFGAVIYNKTSGERCDCITTLYAPSGQKVRETAQERPCKYDGRYKDNWSGSYTITKCTPRNVE